MSHNKAYRQANKQKIAEQRKRPPRRAEKTSPSFYRAKKALKKITPFWANHNYIKLFYKLAREENAEVDHIVPISHPLVCGLHTEHNLQLVTRDYNQYKGNKYWTNMPTYSASDYEELYARTK